MAIHKILHLIGPIIVIVSCVRVFNLSLRHAIVLTLLLGLGKEIRDVLVPGDTITSCLFDMTGNIIGILIAVKINNLIGLLSTRPKLIH